MDSNYDAGAAGRAAAIRVLRAAGHEEPCTEFAPHLPHDLCPGKDSTEDRTKPGPLLKNRASEQS